MNYLDKFALERGISEKTIAGYRTTIHQYEKFHNVPIEQLIHEAIEEEDTIINPNKRMIKTNLLDWRTHLLTQDLSIGTINSKLTYIKSFYRHFDVTVPDIPNLKDNKPQITYHDLPTVKHIRLALESTTLQNQALLLFMVSSGTATQEVANLTKNMFIEATSEYHNGGDYRTILETLYRSKEDIVPTFRMFRQKTKKSYYTFCTPEATQMIVKYLLHELDALELKNKNNGESITVDLDSNLFDVDKESISRKYRYINDKMKWGFKGPYRFFRPHSIRKFHASNIGLSAEYVDALQGRSKETVHETYIKDNPRFLKELYMSVMENVTIYFEEVRQVVNEEYNIIFHLHFHDDGLTTNL